MSAFIHKLNQIRERHRLASISLCVRSRGHTVVHHTLGHARLEPATLCTANQAYDLASVTKVLAGALVTASLIEEGRLALTTPVAHHLPEVDHRITVQHLLHHSSGLPAWRPLYELAEDWGTTETRQALLLAARTTPLQSVPGESHCYSDLGFLTLLALCETVSCMPFDALFHERVRVPSGVMDLRWGWPGAAATEWPCPVRQHGIQGTVHDLNCAALGGVSTHAGLFGTSLSVARLGEACLRAAAGDPAFAGLPGRTLRTFWETSGPGHHRLGWDGISPGYSSTGGHFPPDTVGHLGYTGTSIWMSPQKETVVALLTNRVHPTDDKAPIRAARPEIHNLVAELLGWSQPAEETQ